MIAPDAPAVRFARAGVTWHLVNRAGASLCGAAGEWVEWRTYGVDVGPIGRCGVCRGRAHWLRAERPVPPHADRAAYSRWLQTEWWLAGGLVFPVAGSAQHAQERRA